jgi:rRNA-processing protein EBP2
MAKKNKSKSKAKKQLPPPSPSPSESPESSEDEMNYKSERVTLEQIDAMSDGEEDEIQEWNAEAKALRQAIADGVFDNLKLNSVDQGDDDEEDSDEEEEEGQEEANEEQEEGQDDQSESEEEEEEEEEETDKKPIMKRGISNEKALASVTNTLLTEHAALQWPEKFDIVPSTPLPFGTLDAEGQPIMVHDDLKREVAFYNLALDAVHLARKECHKFNIPFTRPEDFFAEMVKTDGEYLLIGECGHEYFYY